MERIVNVSPEGIPSAPFLLTCLRKVWGTRITSYFRVPTDLVARASRKHRVEREGDACALILLWGKKSTELFPSSCAHRGREYPLGTCCLVVVQQNAFLARPSGVETGKPPA